MMIIIIIITVCFLFGNKNFTKKNSALGHISCVKSYGNSSTSTLREHLTTTHNIDCDDDNEQEDEEDNDHGDNDLPAASEPDNGQAVNKSSTSKQNSANSKSVSKKKQMKLNFKQRLHNFEPFANRYELGRDLVVWAALDLEPFVFVNKSGTRFFFEKNFPAISLSSRNTLSRTALYDVCDTLRNKVKEELSDVIGRTLCVMFDEWSDKYRRYPYIGIRISFVNKNWVYRLITVSLKIVEKHIAENLSLHVRQELAALGINLQSVQLFTTHDGAANMVKTSRLLRSAYYQHCLAHSLHLLLIVDGINTIADLVELLNWCKSVVQRLDARCYLVENARAKMSDRQTMDAMQEKIRRVYEVICADENIQFGLNENNDNIPVENDSYVESILERGHITLKQSNITRWNSVLYMIDSILALWEEMNDALKSNGDCDLCLNEDDKLVLSDLRLFLKPFGDLTDLVSLEAPHLSLMPLIIREVKDAASQQVLNESEVITFLKNKVLARIDNRLNTDEIVNVTALMDPSMKNAIIADIGEQNAKQALSDHTKRAVDRLNQVRSHSEVGTSRSTVPV